MSTRFQPVHSRPLTVLRVGIAMTVGLLLLLAWVGRDVYRAYDEVNFHTARFEDLVRVSHLDEQATRFARMTAVTGDSTWAARAREASVAIDSTITSLRNSTGESEADRAVEQLWAANEAIIRLEDEVIDRALKRRKDDALALLGSDRYNDAKERFGASLGRTTAVLGRDVRSDQQSFESRARLVAIVGGIGGIALLIFWLSALGLIRRYMGEREKGEDRERALVQEQVARAAAERANQTKNEFLSRMSHELRTPLNAILGFGQLLQADNSVADRESVEQILKGGRHLLYLIDEVLDIAKIEAGRVTLSMEPVSLAEVLEDALSMVRHAAADAGVALHVEAQLEGAPFVCADRQRLKQVVLNLLSNAIKYNRAGGSVTISVEKAAGDRLRILVRDTGRGIPTDRIRRLFTPFDRLDAERTGVEGTGLGLALSKGLVEAMGGEIHVETVEGEGSTFSVELATVAAAAPVEMPEAAARQEGPSFGAGHSRTVLFVEDNLANVRLMERILSRRSHVRLLTAMQGSLGIELARQHLPDLILLDVNLPDMSGQEVLEILQQDPATLPIPIVMVSADATPTRINRFRELGARTYLTKPFDVAHLLTIVDEALDGSGLGKSI